LVLCFTAPWFQNLALLQALQVGNPDDLTQYANLGHALMQPPLANVTKQSYTSATPGSTFQNSFP
jgi:hypothetical protein